MNSVAAAAAKINGFNKDNIYWLASKAHLIGCWQTLAPSVLAAYTFWVKPGCCCCPA